MNVLVVGNGGREHALAWKIKKSPLVSRVLITGPNPGQEEIAEDIGAGAGEIDRIVRRALEEQVELVVVGPEAPLVDGLADALEAVKIPVVGPIASAAKLEGSKEYAKEVMTAVGVPTGAYSVVSSVEEGQSVLNSVTHPIVIKASGLAAGKGVYICPDRNSSNRALESLLSEQKFGEAGNRVVIEEFLEGEEVSLIALCSGTEALPFATSQDHKRLLNGDEGPNTGGMGAYAPAPILRGQAIDDAVELTIRPVLRYLAEQGTPFHGFLYAGLMIQNGAPKVLEYNVRMGDPETQAILPLMKGDLVPALLAVGRKESLNAHSLEWGEGYSVVVVAAAEGYPESPRKGDLILGLEADEGSPPIFQAGTVRGAEPNTVLTSGGRVLGITGSGPSLAEAVTSAYEVMEKVTFQGIHYRTDIGYRELARSPAK